MNGSVSIQDLSKHFGKVTALDGVCLDIAEGEKFGIYGADGAGKTTLERILCTLIKPDSGSADIFGFDLVKDKQEIRKLIGFVPSTFSLYMDLSVEENIRFHTDLFGLPFDGKDPMIEPIYRYLEPFSDRLARNLSGGMKQKLALCCALINKPRLLMLDEPTTGIDAMSRQDMIDCLELLNKQFGTTIILSSPYRNEIMMCDRAALMEEGKIVRVGKPSEILPPEGIAVCDTNDQLKEENMIEVEGLTKCFGKFTAVNHISFHVRKGEIFGFLGANGAGKTTAIRMLCGLSKPTSGTGKIAGLDLNKEYEKIKYHIGYVSQRDCLPGDLTVRENLRMAAGLYGIGKKEADYRTGECLRRLGLADYADRLYGSLPLGWKRRVSFAAAMMHDPAVLFLDEPTSGVDVEARKQIWDIIRTVAAYGTTIVVVTHNMEEVLWCDRQCIMVDGVVKAMGDLRAQVKAGETDFYEVFKQVTQASQ